MSGLQYKRDITDEQYGGIWMFFGVSFWTKKSEHHSQPLYGQILLRGPPCNSEKARRTMKILPALSRHEGE